jgi:ribosomal protein L23
MVSAVSEGKSPAPSFPPQLLDEDRQNRAQATRQRRDIWNFYGNGEENWITREKHCDILCHHLFQTEHDIKNYLTKIYQLPVVDVRTRIAMGSTKRDQIVGYITKKEDQKLAYVTLPKEVKFTFPDIFPSEAEDKKKQRDDEKALDASKDLFKKFVDHNKKRRGLPGWYSL